MESKLHPHHKNKEKLRETFRHLKLALIGASHKSKEHIQEAMKIVEELEHSK